MSASALASTARPFGIGRVLRFMPPYYPAAARAEVLTAVKRLVVLGKPLEDEPEEALAAALVAPAEVTEAARAIRDAPCEARKPRVLAARCALQGATGRRAKAAEMEAIARRVDAPMLVSAVDFDALAMARHRVTAAGAQEPHAFARVRRGARGKLLFPPRRRTAVKEEKH